MHKRKFWDNIGPKSPNLVSISVTFLHLWSPNFTENTIEPVPRPRLDGWEDEQKDGRTELNFIGLFPKISVQSYFVV